MIVITRGSVKVSIGDLVVDIMGRGAVIGEMAVLGGQNCYCRGGFDCYFTWLSTASMQQIMEDSQELAQVYGKLPRCVCRKPSRCRRILTIHGIRCNFVDGSMKAK